MTEVMNEIVAVDESTAQALPAQVNNFDIVDVEAAKEFMENYQELVKALLDDNDYQGEKKKKSAWRKLATAFNISDDIIYHDETRDETGQIVSAEFFVKAVLPNGRSSVGVGMCSIYDRIRYHGTDRNPADKETPSTLNCVEDSIMLNMMFLLLHIQEQSQEQSVTLLVQGKFPPKRCLLMVNLKNRLSLKDLNQ